MMRPTPRSGFTLRDMFVAITVICILLALWSMILNSNRDRGHRRAQCLNNLRQITLAMLQYDDAKGSFPGYANKLGGRTTTYVPPLLSYLARGDLYSIWKDPSYSTAQLPVVGIDVLICPADQKQSQANQLSYVVNSGNDSVASAANGVFHDLTAPSPILVGSRFISDHDGASHTLLLSENLQALTWEVPWTKSTPAPMNPSAMVAESRRYTTCVWFDQSPPRPESRRINGDMAHDADFTWNNLDYSRPSSNHAGGVCASHCDGSVHFWSEDIDYDVYKQLMTPDGANSSDSINRAIGDIDF